MRAAADSETAYSSINHFAVAGEPVQIASPETDLSAELKRGLTFVRKQRATEIRKRHSGFVQGGPLCPGPISKTAALAIRIWKSGQGNGKRAPVIALAKELNAWGRTAPRPCLMKYRI